MQEIDPDHVRPVEAFRGLREGDAIRLDGSDWRVVDVTTIKSETDPYIGEVRLRPLDADDPLPSAFIDYRCVCGRRTNREAEFRVKNAGGEWGYEDERTDAFDVIDVAERPRDERPTVGTRYHSLRLDSTFVVDDVDSDALEVAVDFDDERIAIESVPLLVFDHRLSVEDYRPVV